MEVSRIRALRGPNLWSRRTAIEAIVNCSAQDSILERLPDFETRLRIRFPAIGLLRATLQEETISLAHALEYATLGLQAEAGCPVTFSRVSETIEPGVYQVVVEYSEEAVGRLALELAENLCQAALTDTLFDLADALGRLRELDENIRLGPSTGCIVDAAVARGIPYRRLTDGSLVQFGWGSRQRRIQAAETDGSGAIAESIAQDKWLSKKLLRAAGVPVPRGRPVNDADDAWIAAQEIGGPVVVKPIDGNQGKGITVNISTREEVLAAYAIAAQFSDEVMVELSLPGNDFRMLVVGDKLVAAARRDPPQVIGDGAQSVRQLVDQVNNDPRRGEGHATSLTMIRFDEIALSTLAAQGLDADSIPTLGQRVILRNNANLSTGGIATDVTDDVHHDVAAQVVAASQMIGLDICGVDVVCETVLKPLEDQNGGIVEVNAAPGLRMHINPSYGKGRNIGEAIISTIFPNGEDGRIPIVAVTGTNGKTTTVRLISHILGKGGLRVGMTNTDGIYIDNRQIDTGDCSGPRSARNVLLHPEIDAAVFETARGGMLREGLGFDQCKVAVVTNIGKGDHLGLNFITTIEDLKVLKRIIVMNVASDGFAVLNADDPLVAEMAGKCSGGVIFFGSSLRQPAIVTQIAQGKRAIYVEKDEIIVCESKEIVQRIPLSEVPMTMKGDLGFQVENAMSALAAAWALGLDWTVIRLGLATFATDSQTVPGRFNVFTYRNATLIADYGHNPDAIQALVRAIETIPAQRRHVVISGAGDRRDEDIWQQTEILGEAFDEVILYQDQCQRGRDDGEVLALLRHGLNQAGRTKTIHEVHGEFLAIDHALNRLKPGDLCLILIDQIDEALAHISQRIAEG